MAAVKNVKKFTVIHITYNESLYLYNMFNIGWHYLKCFIGDWQYKHKTHEFKLKIRLIYILF